MSYVQINFLVAQTQQISCFFAPFIDCFVRKLMLCIQTSAPKAITMLKKLRNFAYRLFIQEKFICVSTSNVK